MTEIYIGNKNKLHLRHKKRKIHQLFYWLAWNQDNVSEWGDMSIHGLLF
jgi:hypothetical protein